VEHPIPGAVWSKHLNDSTDVVVFCVHGHSRSNNVRDYLRRQGLKAGALDGGIEAWQVFSGGS
jgi:rhodanese-related sulfurtransferase